MSKEIYSKKTLEWNASLAKKEPQEIIEWALEVFQNRIALSCSFSAEDTVLLHILARLRSDIRVFVLDTGRLHEKTYETLENCRARYGISIETYFPDSAKVEGLVREKGPFSFYESLENRKECCFIRKVEPLRRALSGLDAWFTGLRREQSVTRTNAQICEVDENHRGENGPLIKLNPLLYWSWDQVMDFAKKNGALLHPLHAEGYPSIGCEPCTRAVAKGEDARSGRWWWESPENKECGLHK